MTAAPGNLLAMPSTSAPRSGARAVAVYTVARAVVFGGVLVVLALVGLRGLPLLLAALVASGILSYVLLAPQRIAVARTVQSRVARPRRSRLRDRIAAADAREDAYVDAVEEERRRSGSM